MRYFGSLHTPPSPSLPDTRLSLLMTANSAQAFDYPSKCDLIRITVGSTVAGFGSIFFEPNSTGAALPTTGGAVTTAGTSGALVITQGEERVYQRPQSSTGFSLISPTSSYVSIEFWSRAGST